jgi:hypothetical protein
MFLASIQLATSSDVFNWFHNSFHNCSHSSWITIFFALLNFAVFISQASCHHILTFSNVFQITHNHQDIQAHNNASVVVGISHLEVAEYFQASIAHCQAALNI